MQDQVPGIAIADASPQAVPPWVKAYAHFEGVHLVLHKLYSWYVCWGDASLLATSTHCSDEYDGDRFDDYDSALAAFTAAAERLREGRL